MSLTVGVSPFSLARRLGPPVERIDRTDGLPEPDVEDYELELLDAYDSRDVAAKGQEPR